MLFPAAALPRLLLKARGMENSWHSGKMKREEIKHCHHAHDSSQLQFIMSNFLQFIVKNSNLRH